MTEAKSSPKARGERLRRVRNLANLSRAQMCEDDALNYNTFKGWELGRFGGLTKGGAKRACVRLAEAGVACSPDWLLYEMGPPPEVNLLSLEYQAPEIIEETPSTEKQKNYLTEELELFRKHFPYALDYVVTDDSMLPQFNPGDTVAGVKVKEHEEAIDKVAIITLNNGKTLLRMIKKDPQDPKCFILLATNLDAHAPDLILQGVKPHGIAPILWHRRPFVKT
ncbi:MAG: hypothetical protein NTV32_08165 [Gammaproteobacteria bacterium]|nr:hypothetical protein [Gammaproteobacteria bacterium]